MSQKVQCPKCKASLVVKPELFGKKIKCSKCQNVLLVKAPTTSTAPSPAASQPSKVASPGKTPTPANAAKKTVVRCQCGTSMKVAAKLAGKQVRCPGCKSVVKVPVQLSDAAPPQAAVPPQPAAPQPTAADPTAGFGLQDIDLSADASVGADPLGAPAGDPLWDALPPQTTESVPSFVPSGLPAAQPASSPGASAATPTPMGGGAAAEKLANAQVELENERNRVYEDDEPPSWLASRLYGLAFVVMIGGPIVTYTGCRDHMKSSAIAHDGVTVPGVIMSGVEKRGGRRSFGSTYTLQVAYKTEEGEAKVQDFPVTGGYFKEHTDASSITNDACQVQYSKSDPSTAMIVGGTTSAPVKVVIGIAMLFAGIGGIVLLKWIDLD